VQEEQNERYLYKRRRTTKKKRGGLKRAGIREKCNGGQMTRDKEPEEALEKKLEMGGSDRRNMNSTNEAEYAKEAENLVLPPCFLDCITLII